MSLPIKIALIALSIYLGLNSICYAQTKLIYSGLDCVGDLSDDQMELEITEFAHKDENSYITLIFTENCNLDLKAMYKARADTIEVRIKNTETNLAFCSCYYSITMKFPGIIDKAKTIKFDGVIYKYGEQ